MIKIGMTVAERYEVLEKIGTGGMSDVYRAKDHKLNRFVAIKVLKQEFSENKDFLQKFRSEAQSAAGLMHPNIVNVYDVGEESGSHYIVMELVEGITLKKYIERKARLSVREAVSIAIQVAQGIEAAHNNHIIHRDIKPQNVIISMDGKVKVTDFGIAKAASSNTITSNVMGSVHYTSPEQVRGGFSDEKSDIYSLGITIFEMLTGRVPFNGDTTVAVAIKHIQEPMPSPRDYVPEIPISLEKIVLKCTQKSPDRRYASAPELIEDLKKSLISPDEDFVKLDENDHSGDTKDISPQEIKKIRAQANRRDSFDAQMLLGGATMPEGEAAGEEMPEEEYYPEEGEYEGEYGEEYIEGEGEEYYPEEEMTDDGSYAGAPVIEEIISKRKKGSDDAQQKGQAKKKKKKRRPAGEKADAADKNEKRATSRANGRPVAPDAARKHAQGTSGRPRTAEERRRNASRNAGRRKGRYEDEYDPRMELLTTVLIVIAALVVAVIFLYIVWNAVGFGKERPGSSSQTTATPTVEQSTEEPTKAGTQVGTDGRSLPVPSVVGLTKAEATAKLESDGFKVILMSTNSEDVARDVVVRQDPEGGSSVPIGSEITVTYSIGKESIQVPMPDLKGKTEEEATRLLAEAGLTGKKGDDEYSEDYPEGTVCYQNYSAGSTVNNDTEVEYRISKGVEPAYYKLDSYVVDAPGDYAGGNATITLTAEDGTQLWSITTDVFPVKINNLSGIYMKPRGILTIDYMINESQEVTDEEGNVSIQTVQVPKHTDGVIIEFKKE
ncbi:MAG: Stk1 family PASTA domain-containing Ser/Thr kinase [Lachnospiraceae bacterium]|nr:Stk1 family PASTA domain-containing Ser/Thr kinase [Lachnospiraceae bacterium]